MKNIKTNSSAFSLILISALFLSSLPSFASEQSAEPANQPSISQLDASAGNSGIDDEETQLRQNGLYRLSMDLLGRYTPRANTKVSETLNTAGLKGALHVSYFGSKTYKIGINTPITGHFLKSASISFRAILDDLKKGEIDDSISPNAASFKELLVNLKKSGVVSSAAFISVAPGPREDLGLVFDQKDGEYDITHFIQIAEVNGFFGRRKTTYVSEELARRK